MVLNSCPASAEGETPKQDRVVLDEYIMRPGGTVTSRNPLHACSTCSMSIPLLWHRSFLGSTLCFVVSTEAGGLGLADGGSLKVLGVGEGRASKGEP